MHMQSFKILLHSIVLYIPNMFIMAELRVYFCPLPLGGHQVKTFGVSFPQHFLILFLHKE